MATAATRKITIGLSGDVSAQHVINAASNAASPGQVDLVTLASGFNSVSVPTGGSTPVSVTIIPPTGNATTLTLKGVTGDTGIAIHLTDPTTVAIASSVTAIGLTAGATITGVRLYWT